MISLKMLCDLMYYVIYLFCSYMHKNIVFYHDCDRDGKDKRHEKRKESEMMCVILSSHPYLCCYPKQSMWGQCMSPLQVYSRIQVCFSCLVVFFGRSLHCIRFKVYLSSVLK